MIRTVLLIAAVVLLTGAGAPLAATLKVPQDFPTITEAIDAAAEGDTVLVEPGQYPETLVIRRAVHLVAGGPDTEIAARERAVPVVEFQEVKGPSSLRGFKINGKEMVTAGVSAVESTVDVISNEIFMCSVGVFFRRSQGKIEGNRFHGNAAGELRFYGSSPLVVRNQFDGSGPMAIQIVGKNSQPTIGGSRGQGNVFGPGYTSLISNEAKNEINARYNQWSWSATVEMGAGGYPCNVSAIYDGFDDPALGKVDFSHWEGGASAGPRMRPVVWVLVVGLAVVLVGVLAWVRARRRLAS